MPKSNNPLKSLGRWVKEEIVQDVPANTALCAFDCRKLQCTSTEWETCERRLASASGELMPADEAHGKK